MASIYLRFTLKNIHVVDRDIEKYWGGINWTFDEVSLGIGFIEMEAPGQEGMYCVMVDEIRANSEASRYNRLVKGSVLAKIGEESYFQTIG